MRKGSNRELYRDPSRGKIAGVCAGLADYFGMEIWLVRILVVSGVLLGLQFFIVVYIAGWFILDKKCDSKKTTRENMKSPADATHGYACKDSPSTHDSLERSIKVKAKIWQSGEPPRQAFHDISTKFNKLENQLRMIERYVTSPEFTVSREINRL